jgi:hypothetical protein
MARRTGTGSPALVVLEDLDLVVGNRRSGREAAAYMIS